MVVVVAKTDVDQMQLFISLGGGLLHLTLYLSLSLCFIILSQWWGSVLGLHIPLPAGRLVGRRW